MQPHIDRNNDQAGRKAAIDELEDAWTVGQAERYAVAPSQSLRKQIAGDRQRALLELAISNDFLAMHDCRLGWKAPRDVAQKGEGVHRSRACWNQAQGRFMAGP